MLGEPWNEASNLIALCMTTLKDFYSIQRSYFSSAPVWPLLLVSPMTILSTGNKADGPVLRLAPVFPGDKRGGRKKVPAKIFAIRPPAEQIRNTKPTNQRLGTAVTWQAGERSRIEWQVKKSPRTGLGHHGNSAVCEEGEVKESEEDDERQKVVSDGGVELIGHAE